MITQIVGAIGSFEIITTLQAGSRGERCNPLTAINPFRDEKQETRCTITVNEGLPVRCTVVSSHLMSIVADLDSSEFLQHRLERREHFVLQVFYADGGDLGGTSLWSFRSLRTG